MPKKSQIARAKKKPKFKSRVVRRCFDAEEKEHI